MLTDRDKVDIFYFTVEMTQDAENSDNTHIDLVAGATHKAMQFLISHPDMCAAEFDDFLSDKEYALQEFNRLIERKDIRG